MKTQNLKLTAVMGAVLLTMAACGGSGDDEPTQTSAPPTLINPAFEAHSDLKALLADVQNDEPETLVARLALKEEAYSLSSDVGLFGKQLQNDSWTIGRADLRKIPNTPETVVYVNASSKDRADVAELVDFFKQFQGVVIVDSDRESTSVGSEAISSSPSDSGANAATEIIESAEGGNHVVADYFMKLFPDNGVTMKGTAIIKSSSLNDIIGVDVDASGRINGYEGSEFFKSVGPEFFVASNWKAALASLVAPSRASRQGTPSGGRVARSASVNRLVGDYIVAGKIDAYAGVDGSNQRTIYVTAFTGSKEQACQVGSNQCGVYPKSLDAAIRYRYDTSKKHWEVTSMATQYQVSASTNDSNNTRPYLWAPSAETWLGSGFDKDYKEVTTSRGLAIGAGFAIPGVLPQFFSAVVPSASGSFSVVSTRRSTPWEGFSNKTTGNVVVSGIKLKRGRARQLPGGWEWNSATPDAAWKQAYLDKVLLGTGACRDNDTKATMAIRGYRPSLAAEIPVSNFKNGVHVTQYNLAVTFLYSRAVQYMVHHKSDQKLCGNFIIGPQNRYWVAKKNLPPSINDLGDRVDIDREDSFSTNERLIIYSNQFTK